MQPPDGDTAQRREVERIPFQIRVHLEFRDQRCFLSETATDLSPSGMFVRSESPREPGDRFDFEARLTERGPPLVGKGEVMWIRVTGEDGPPGMGTRFLELDSASRELLVRLNDAYLIGGPERLHREVEAAATAWEQQVAEEDSTVSVPPPAPVLPDTEVIRLPKDAAAVAAGAASPTEPTAPGDQEDVSTPPGRSPAPGLTIPAEAPVGEPAAAAGDAVGAAEQAPNARPSPSLEGVAETAEEESTGDHLWAERGGPSEMDATGAEAAESDPLEGPAEPASEEPVDDQDQAAGKPPAETRTGLRVGRLAGLLLIALMLLFAGLLLPEWGLPGDWRSWWNTLSEPRPEALPPRGAPGVAAAFEAEQSKDLSSPSRAVEAAGRITEAQELRVIRSIEGRPSGEGLLIALRLDGPMGAERVRHLRLEDPLRVVLQLSGIAERYAGEAPEATSAGVARIRLGYHPGEQGPEQHIVFDLADPRVVLRTVRETRDGLEVLLGRP